MTDDATPKAIPSEEAVMLVEPTPNMNPMQTRPTAPRVMGEDLARRRNQEKKTVKGRTRPRATW